MVAPLETELDVAPLEPDVVVSPDVLAALEVAVLPPDAHAPPSHVDFDEHAATTQAIEADDATTQTLCFMRRR